MNNMKDLMLDLETMGNRPTSAIIQIGACYFDRNDGTIGETFLKQVSLADSMEWGLTVDASTIQWWVVQENKSWLNNPESLVLVLDAFDEFYKSKTYVWSHSTFDIPILNNAYSKLGRRIPCHYRLTRDLRTLTHLAGSSKNESIEVRDGGADAHNALNDCLYQVKYTVECLNKLKGKE
jgi:DNA polymerase III epsilon subunit-like protein